MAEKTVTAELSRNAGDETAAENEMGTLPIGKLLRKMSLPLIISMLVQVLYGLVDSMYVARLGDSALTAISLCMPVQYLAVGIGIGLGVGVNSVLSKKLGEGDKQGVNRAAGNGMLLIWLVSIAFVFIGLFAMEPFYRMQTDIEEVSQAVFLLLSAWLLSLSGSAVLVWLAFPIMEILRFFIGVFMVRKTYKKQIAVI